ncbi:hypothetical protein [Amycolatopsis sp. MtRt-6]|uniref:hypothetical protein n=1 Tax=Amycolatopsis sp. MtRt-6 TaxID=2792782 RepID=UPI001A8FF3E2|nr:hypothetical protein [Amycolatopsis sp. MtRt-6]
MNNIRFEFPAGKLLDRLGPTLARLILLKRFSPTEAIRYSNGQFNDTRFARYIEMVFTQDPLTDDFYVRPELDASLLDAIANRFPRVPQDLTHLLLTERVGLEVLEPEEFLSWIVRERLSTVSQATVAGMAIYGELEIAPALRALMNDTASRSSLATTLSTYALPARRWLAAGRPRHSAGAANVLANLPDSLAMRPRRRSDFMLDNGLEPQRWDFVRPRRTRETVQLEMVPLPTAGLLGSSNSLQLPSPESDRFTAGVALSESTVKLLQLVMGDRGQTHITDRLQFDISRQMVERTASVSIAATAIVDDTAFVHLGAAPRSVGNALTRTVTVDNEPLTWGGGAIINRYLQEMTILLTEQASRLSSGDALSASDWYRLERSVREPWRFLSTKRTFIHFGVAELSWTTKLKSDELTRSFDLWPFDGSSLNTVAAEGFRCGADDGYNVHVNCVDTSAIVSVSIDTVNRSPQIPALERPSRIRTFLVWPLAIYCIALLLTVVCGAILIATGISAEQASQLDNGDINVTLSILSLATGPVVAWLTAAQFNKHGSRVAYIRQYGRMGLVVIGTITLIVLTLIGSRHSIARELLSVVDIVVGVYLGVAAALSSGLRLARTSIVRHRLADSER